ncbi:tetratricopeptide repeat protein [Crenobacter caeni]|uniref:Sel1 repeat family protein n=1 Tax=Crenobacter caeni TaxID=2705474 RepID=A0A6B2KU70_9NEIS|nr:tetratricopeptide repeat protein [Crenobacter caeni]NDV13549.1 sel1 repeat family protein [Crenobacter caeni]
MTLPKPGLARSILSAILLLACLASATFALAGNADTPFSRFRAEAMRGDADAQVSLGALYYEGAGGAPQDNKLAAYWYRQAAGQGHPNGQLFLGAMYEQGKGVPHSQVIAYALYNLSTSAFDYPLAGEFRAHVAQQMSVTQIEAGQALTKKLAIPGHFHEELDRAQRAVNPGPRRPAPAQPDTPRDWIRL